MVCNLHFLHDLTQFCAMIDTIIEVFNFKISIFITKYSIFSSLLCYMLVLDHPGTHEIADIVIDMYHMIQ